MEIFFSGLRCLLHLHYNIHSILFVWKINFCGCPTWEYHQIKTHQSHNNDLWNFTHTSPFKFVINIELFLKNFCGAHMGCDVTFVSDFRSKSISVWGCLHWRHSRRGLLSVILITRITDNKLPRKYPYSLFKIDFLIIVMTLGATRCYHAEVTDRLKHFSGHKYSLCYPI